MNRINITFLDPLKATWIRIQQIMFAIHACETYIELEMFLDKHKEEFSVEYINKYSLIRSRIIVSDGTKKLPVPHIGFRQLVLSFTPEQSDTPVPQG